MKQFDRPFLEQYKRNPRINSFFQNFFNPSAEGQYSAPVQPSVPNQFQSPAQAPMQQNNQVIERWPQQYQGLIPQSMQGMNSAQVLQELQKAYQGNQAFPQRQTEFNNNIAAQRANIENTENQQAAKQALRQQRLQITSLSPQERQQHLQNAMNQYITAYEDGRRNKIAVALNPTPAMRAAKQEINKYNRGLEAENYLSSRGYNF